MKNIKFHVLIIFLVCPLFAKDIYFTRSGTISFFYGTPNFYNIECQEFFPEEGMLYLFPKDLKHFVSPFFSKCERVSVAANFITV